jgi:hypothetical protein
VKNSWDIMFDHIRFDFGVKGILIFNGASCCQRISIVGYPFVREVAINDNEARR